MCLLNVLLYNCFLDGIVRLNFLIVRINSINIYNISNKKLNCNSKQADSYFYRTLWGYVNPKSLDILLLYIGPVAQDGRALGS